MQGKWLRSLLEELGSYMLQGNLVCELQLRSWDSLESLLHSKRSLCTATKTQHIQINNEIVSH